MIVLSIDSATESASCSIMEDNRLLGEINFNYKKQHSVILMPIIDELLNNLSLSIKDIDGFVVSKGPGSFTGLRIGIATVKGLSHGSGRPFLGVSSLDALAFNMAYTSGIICPILDALRGNVYTCLYTFEDGKLKKLKDYMVVSIDELIDIIGAFDQPSCFIGDAVPLYKELLSEKLNKVKFAPAHLNLVRSSALAELGIELLSSGIHDDFTTFAPIYLRKSQAEREYDKKAGREING